LAASAVLGAGPTLCPGAGAGAAERSQEILYQRRIKNFLFLPGFEVSIFFQGTFFI
jgi:hypothetical protein